jgi:hypothetical protein
MTYRCNSAERAARVPPISAEVIALQRLSALGQEEIWPPELAQLTEQRYNST